MSVPANLRFSEAFKAVSVPSGVVNRIFNPVTSGDYTTSNNIIRIPLNAPNFLDLRNLVVRMRLRNTTAGRAYLDGSAQSVIRDMLVVGPDGQYLSQVQYYNKLYQTLCDVERSLGVSTSVFNALEGSTRAGGVVLLQTTATVNVLEVYYNGDLMGSLTLGGGVATVLAGEWRFSTTAGAGVLGVSYRGSSITCTLNTASIQRLGGNSFETNTTATTSLIVNGVALDFAVSVTDQAQIIQDGGDIGSAYKNSEVFAQNEYRTYCLPIMCPLTRLPVSFPAHKVAGGGVMLEIRIVNDATEAFYTATNIAPNFTIDNVVAIVPVLSYPSAVLESFDQMLQAMGSVSMSSVDFQSYVVPITNTTVSAPIAFRNRSLRAIFGIFQQNQTTADYTVPRTSARDYPFGTNLGTLQLLIGSATYPSQPIQCIKNGTTDENISEIYTNLQQAVSKLGSIVHGSGISKQNIFLSHAGGGKFVFGINLEASQGDVEAGVDTTANGLSSILNITNLGAGTGTLYVYAMFDCTLSLLSSGNLIMSR